jgi:hypothetical protein
MTHVDVLKHVAGDGVHRVAFARSIDDVDQSSLLLVALVALAVKVVEGKRHLSSQRQRLNHAGMA